MTTDVTTEDQIEKVSEADVRAAELEAAHAEARAAELVNKVESGSDDVTFDEIDASQKAGVFARLRATGMRAKADRYRVAARARRIKELSAEVRETAPRSGDELVAALSEVERAARNFLELAADHDERLRAWILRVQAFHIDAGQREHGVGLNGIGQLVVADVVFDEVNGPLRLGGIFHNQQSGYAVPLPIKAENDDARLATYRLLDQIGEGL